MRQTRATAAGAGVSGEALGSAGACYEGGPLHRPGKVRGALASWGENRGEGERARLHRCRRRARRKASTGVARSQRSSAVREAGSASTIFPREFVEEQTSPHIR